MVKMQSEFVEDHLSDLLPLYYRRLFPLIPFCKWLSYGSSDIFERREISFTLIGDIYLRYQSFTSIEDFAKALSKNFPLKIDVGAIYKSSPQARTPLSALTPEEKEIVFDIDLTDYDDVRSCCSGAGVCPKCWKLMVIACRILETALRDDFGFSNILWVFSGRRGVHCWIADPDARKIDDNCRSAVAEYLQVIKGGMAIKKAKLMGEIHPSIGRALGIIDKYFINDIVREQDILGGERLNTFLSLIDEEIVSNFTIPLSSEQDSESRWRKFDQIFQDLRQKRKIPVHLQNLREELKLHYCYPRLDINVTKGINHLLKAPFCVHPKSGKIAVPFSAKLVENFDPSTVPTITQLINEINAYDAQTMEQEKSFSENDQSFVKIKDYKKTSLLRYVNVFNEFLRGIMQKSINPDENAMEI